MMTMVLGKDRRRQETTTVVTISSTMSGFEVVFPAQGSSLIKCKI